eukprot:NODE_213_length_14376_cov_0.499054.p2 type:complete len:483 gc:universal NODE_213_length_14376_cov_0.499054:11706-13154(+)
MINNFINMGLNDLSNLESDDECLTIAQLLLKFYQVGLSSDSEDEEQLENKLKEISKQRQHLQRKQHYIMESSTVKLDLKDWINQEQSKLVQNELEIQVNKFDNITNQRVEYIDLDSDVEIEIVPDKKVSSISEIKKIMRQRKKRINTAKEQGWKLPEKQEESEEVKEAPIKTLEDLEERDWENEEKAGLELMKKLLQENQELQDRKMNWDYNKDDEMLDIDDDVLELENSDSLSDYDGDVKMQTSKHIIDSESDSNCSNDGSPKITTNLVPTIELAATSTQETLFFPNTAQSATVQEEVKSELDDELEKEIIQNAKKRQLETRPTLSEWVGIEGPVSVTKEETNKYVEIEAQISEDELAFDQGDDEMNTDDELNEFHNDLKLDLQNNENTAKGVDRVKRLHRKQITETDKQQTVNLLKDLSAGTLGMTREQRLALKEKGFSMEQENVDFELLELEQNRKNRKRKKTHQWNAPQSIGRFGNLN